MKVDPARAAGHFDYKGETYYFCGKGCLAKFSADPEKYLSGAREPHHHAPAQVVTIGGLSAPKHSGIRVPRTAAPEHPGTPAPGHASTVVPTHAATDVEYTCPMHPEIVQIGPGVCPMCGMALEP